MVYPYNPTNDPIRVYGRKPTIAEIADNRRCWEYIFYKRAYGTFDSVNNRYIPDQRSISELWSEARITYVNAFATTAPRFDNPEISPDALT